jgi:hypothetical protein
MLARALLVASSVVLAAACGLLPEFGISRNQAIAVAIDRAALSHAVLFAADKGNWPVGSEPRPAWIVTIRGDYLECEGPGRGRQGPEHCQMVDGQAIIYVDFSTGEFLGGNVGGPINDAR